MSAFALSPCAAVHTGGYLDIGLAEMVPCIEHFTGIMSQQRVAIDLFARHLVGWLMKAALPRELARSDIFDDTGVFYNRSHSHLDGLIRRTSGKLRDGDKNCLWHRRYSTTGAGFLLQDKE